MIFISLMAVLIFTIIISGSAFGALYESSQATKIPCGVQNKDVHASTLSQQNATVNVTIQNLAFNPSNITVANGTTVVWTNNDIFIPHSVISDTKVYNSEAGTFSPAFNSGNLSPGASFAFQFNTTGTFNYHCGHHSLMRGTVIVT
jgi:plastocyanin